MKEVLYSMRLICVLEGSSGFILNLILLCFLIPIYVSSLQGLYLCLAIALMNFTHIFYDGTLAVPLVGPAVQLINKYLRDLLYQAAFVVMSFMWTLTPSTAILQFIVLSRCEISEWKRLVIAFIPTLLCLTLVACTVSMTMPSPELEDIMERTMKELYGMEEEEFLQCYGISIKHAHLNNGKSLLLFTATFAAIPYSVSYSIIVTMMMRIRRLLSSHGITLSKTTLRLQRQFFVMQFLQSFLPLVILSVPLAIIVYGALAGAQLGFWSLPLTVFVWICPVVQASVQLRYVVQSRSITPKSSRVALSRNEGER
ncbi:hypothetical protein PMAYCL1PPCAC_07396, partial [Pristionchus mayeri]